MIMIIKMCSEVSAKQVKDEAITIEFYRLILFCCILFEKIIRYTEESIFCNQYKKWAIAFKVG